MVFSETVSVYMNAYNTKRYKNLGYDVHYGKYYDIQVKDLPDCFTGDVEFECDYCHCKFKRRWEIYMRNKKKSPIQKDACKECFPKKLEESMMLQYGVKNTMELDATKKKLAETNIEKYGCENVFQNAEIKKKAENAMMEKYGVKVALKNEELKKKFIETNTERYGGSSPLCDENVRKKSFQTMRRKGDPNGYMCSIPQRYLWDLYGGKINVPVGRYCVDILFEEEKIEFEYSGGGHKLGVILGTQTEESFEKKEENRRLYLLEKGYKQFEIISSNDIFPSDEFLVKLKEKAFDVLLNTDVNYYGYNLNTNEEIYK